MLWMEPQALEVMKTCCMYEGDNMGKLPLQVSAAPVFMQGWVHSTSSLSPT